MYVCVCRYQGERMKNVFVVNDQYDAAVALYWLENNVLNSQTGHSSSLCLLSTICMQMYTYIYSNVCR